MSNRSRNVAAVVCALTSVAVLPSSIADAVPFPQPQYGFTFQLPDGSPMGLAVVGVLLTPFDPPPAYSSPVIAGGVTTPSGTFGFNLWQQDIRFDDECIVEGTLCVDGVPGWGELEDPVRDALPGSIPAIDTAPIEDAIRHSSFLGEDVLDTAPPRAALDSDWIETVGSPVVNAHIQAVSADRSWMASWDVVLPLDATYHETIQANVALGPEAQGMSTLTLAGLTPNITTCLPNDEPDGFDPMLNEIETDADGLTGVAQDNLTDPARICAVSVQPAVPGNTSVAERRRLKRTRPTSASPRQR